MSNLISVDKQEFIASNIEAVKKVWEFCKRSLRPKQQYRIRANVLKGMPIKKAFEREGFIFCRTSVDLSCAKELFSENILTIEERKPEPLAVLNKASQADPDNPIEKKEFIPRPKSSIDKNK